MKNRSAGQGPARQVKNLTELGAFQTIRASGIAEGAFSLHAFIGQNMRPLSRIVEELAPDYLAARKVEIPQMLQLLAGCDFDRLHVLSHSLKGSGGSFGFPELSRLGAALERHAEAGDGAGFAEELARLKDYLEHLECSPTSASTEQGSKR